jgi:hypothetical protein
MKCEKCGKEVTGNAKFCPNCGGKVSSDQTMSPEQIDLDWLNGIMLRLGYERDKEKEGENEVFGIHKTLHNLALNLKKPLGIISFQSFFVMKKAGWGGRAEQLAAVNKANGLCNISTWFFTDNTEIVGAYSFMPLVESLTEGDVIVLIEKFNKEIDNALTNSGISNYLPK